MGGGPALFTATCSGLGAAADPARSMRPLQVQPSFRTSDRVTLTKGPRRRRQTLPTLSFSLGAKEKPRPGSQARAISSSHQGRGYRNLFPRHLQAPLSHDYQAEKRAKSVPWRTRGILHLGTVPTGHSHLPRGAPCPLAPSSTSSEPGQRQGRSADHQIRVPASTSSDITPGSRQQEATAVAETHRRASGLQATGRAEEVKLPLPTRTTRPGNHRMGRKSFPEPGSISHTETLNSCGHTSSVCRDAAGELSRSQPQAELKA